MIVDHTDDKKRLVYGVLDKPVNDYAGKVKLGSQLAVSYDNIREHKKAAEFKSQNGSRPLEVVRKVHLIDHGWLVPKCSVPPAPPR